MPKPELGEKQTCPECAAKFYDLTKRPAVCPKCGHSFNPDELANGEQRAKEKERPVDEETTTEEEVEATETDEDEEEDTVLEVDAEAEAEGDLDISSDDEDTPGAKQAFTEPSVDDEVDDEDSGMSIMEGEEDLPDLDDDTDIDLGEDEADTPA